MASAGPNNDANPRESYIRGHHLLSQLVIEQQMTHCVLIFHSGIRAKKGQKNKEGTLWASSRVWNTVKFKSDF